MNRFDFRKLLIIAVAVAWCWGAATAFADMKRVVFVAGDPSHGYGAHEHYAGSLLLSNLLNENHPGVTSTVHQNGWPKDPSAFDGANAIVIFANGGDHHPAMQNRDVFEKLVEAGIGVALLHWGTGVSCDVGKEWVEWVGANKEPNWSVNPFWVIDPELTDHPINRGVAPFSINDEWYFHLRFRNDMANITPILSAHPPESTVRREDGPFSSNPHVREAVLERKEIQHVAWAAENEHGGRSFGLTGAHWHWNWAHPMLRKQVLNGIAWTAGAEIPDGGISAGTITIEDLKANQDYEMPEGFDIDHWANLVKEWTREFGEQ